MTPEYSASIALSADDVIIANKTYGTVKTQPTVSYELESTNLIDFWHMWLSLNFLSVLNV